VVAAADDLGDQTYSLSKDETNPTGTLFHLSNVVVVHTISVYTHTGVFWVT